MATVNLDEWTQTRIRRRSAILSTIKDDLVARLNLEILPEDIDDDTFLFGGGLGLDSIDSMEVILGIQSCFGVEIPEGDVAPFAHDQHAGGLRRGERGVRRATSSRRLRNHVTPPDPHARGRSPREVIVRPIPRRPAAPARNPST